MKETLRYRYAALPSHSTTAKAPPMGTIADCKVEMRLVTHGLWRKTPPFAHIHALLKGHSDAVAKHPSRCKAAHAWSGHAWTHPVDFQCHALHRGDEAGFHDAKADYAAEQHVPAVRNGESSRSGRAPEWGTGSTCGCSVVA